MKSAVEEHELGGEWTEHRGGIPLEVKSDKSMPVEKGPEDPSSGEEVGEGSGPDASAEFEGKSEAELKDLLMAQGIPAKKLKGKSKAELISMIEG